jgi:hypothetical protein
MTSGHT